MKPYKTITMPIISTAHLSQSISANASALLMARYDEGWFIYMDEEPSDYYPVWYEEIRVWARKEGFEWVRFDSDGPIIDLPTYKWKLDR